MHISMHGYIYGSYDKNHTTNTCFHHDSNLENLVAMHIYVICLHIFRIAFLWEMPVNFWGWTVVDMFLS